MLGFGKDTSNRRLWRSLPQRARSQPLLPLTGLVIGKEMVAQIFGVIAIGIDKNHPNAEVTRSTSCSEGLSLWKRIVRRSVCANRRSSKAQECIRTVS